MLLEIGSESGKIVIGEHGAEGKFRQKRERFTLHCRDHAVPTSDWASFARFCRHRIMPLQRVRDGAANLGDISKVVLASESSGAACTNFHSQRFEPEGSLICLDEFRSEAHTSELQSLMPNSYDVSCLKKTNK